MVALVAGVLGAPATLHAQEPAGEPRVHVVRPGDTLWEIARIYLGDPFLWPEIYRVNSTAIEDPHWIFPGESLQIPSGIGQPVIVAETPDTLITDPITDPMQPERTPVYVAPVARSTGPTVFSTLPQHARRQNELQRESEMPREGVRSGEFRAAPWVDRDGGPRNAGRVVTTTEMSGIAFASERTRYLYQERIYVLPPNGAAAGRGDRYLTFRIGPRIHNVGQVIIPTGIVELEEPGNGNANVAAVARIVQQFDEVRRDDRLTLLEPFPLEPGVHAVASDIGITSRVVWIQDEPVLPSMLRYLVLDATARDGVRLGDQFTLVRPPVYRDDGARLPEQEIAVAQVVRVTEFGITAIILDQVQPAIRPGTLARVTARMP